MIGGKGDDFVIPPSMLCEEPGMEVGTWKGARPMLNFKGINWACQWGLLLGTPTKVPFFPLPAPAVPSNPRCLPAIAAIAGG